MRKLLFGCLILGLTLAFPSYAASRTGWCETSTSSCLVVHKGQSWQSLFPDEYQRGIVMRVNRTNASLHAGKVIKIPHNLASSSLLDHSPFAHQINPPNEKLMIFDPVKHAWAAYDADGTLVNWGPATGGNTWCKDINRSCKTKSGYFRVYSLGSAGCKSSKFPVGKGGAPMPYCMFFNGGQAFHGSPGAVVAGNVSHGCVRLFVDDARWLRYNFITVGTKVIVRPY